MIGRGRVLKSTAIAFFLLILLFSSPSLKALEGPTSGSVHVIEIRGDIVSARARMVEEGLRRAEREGAELILIPLDTFGGLVDAALRIKSAILNSQVQTVVLVEDRAWSAGALIALSADRIVMAPGSSMGAAETRPREEKFISALRGEFKSLAELRGRDPELAEAMVDVDLKIEGVVEEGKLLTLTATEAHQLGMADLIARSPQEALEGLGFTPTRMVQDQPSLAEEYALLVSSPIISIILIAGGLLGLYTEIVTAGWAVPGTLGVLSLSLFFSGQMIAGEAGWGPVMLFVGGLLLLALEIFVVPGFGVTGAGGILALFLGIFLSIENTRQAFQVLSISLVVTVIGGVLLFRFLGRSRTWDRLVLSTSEEKDQGYMAPKDHKKLLGKKGVALTPLHPTGRGEFGEERLDVVSEGQYLKAGDRIVIIGIEGNRIVVRRLEE